MWGQNIAPYAWKILTTPIHTSVSEEGIEQYLPTILPPGTRILAENSYAHGLVAGAGIPYELVPIWSPEVMFIFDRRLSPIEQRRRLLERKITAVLFYPGSADTVFCRRSSAFYAYDCVNWKLLGKFKDLCYVYALPPP